MKIHVKNFYYLRAQMLRKLLILLSLPLMISSCKTSEKQLSEPDPQMQDSAVVTPADTTNPNYYNPESSGSSKTKKILRTTFYCFGTTGTFTP